MIEILLIAIILLTIINMIVTLKKKAKVDIHSQLNEFEDRINNELQRNRNELNDLSEKNRKELTGSIASFEKTLSENSHITNAILDDKFRLFNACVR